MRGKWFYEGFEGIIEGMININHEGPIAIPAIPEDDADTNVSELTLDQQRELLLMDAKIALGKIEVKKLELEVSGVEDFATKTEIRRLEDEIVKHKYLVESLEKAG